MTPKFTICVIVLFYLMPRLCIGQNGIPNTYTQLTIIVDTCDLKVSSYSLIPTTVSISHNGNISQHYSIDNHTIRLQDSVCNAWQNDTIIVSFKTFGFDIYKKYFTLDSSQLIFSDQIDNQGFTYTPDKPSTAIIESQGLDYRGSFSRGFSIGNSQSLIVNSNFDMQLKGDLGNGLRIVAAISDENLPIQAQGNTQQLQEFDRVFIQIAKGNTTVTAGDYELKRPNSYFMNYFKKLKGISVATTFTPQKNGELYTKGSFAISRGKFARQNMATSEGNQGPYRLQGANGEKFIIVLAGTEKVFFNGILLTRGYDYDYIIDYNRAEITFSPTRVVARDSRVIIEFEYTDISYVRSLYAAESSYKYKKLTANFNVYTEQDSKNATGDVQLDSTDLNILANAGDDVNKTVRSSLRPLTTTELNEANRVFYHGIEDPNQPGNIILLFTSNIDSAQYSARFTDVGANKGDYVIDNIVNKNGRVFKYVGKGNGSYLPIVQLIPPEQKQLITLNANYQFDKSNSVFSEVSLSNLNKNRLSFIDNKDNVGYASHIAFQNQIHFDSLQSWKLLSTVKHEFIHKYFNPLNPFRVPEFTRDWNIAGITSKGNENLLYANVNITSKSGVDILYGFNHFDRVDAYNGNRHEIRLGTKNNRLLWKAYTNYLTSVAPILGQSTSFIRPNVSSSYLLGKKKNWTIGFELDGESNKIRLLTNDSLLRNSYAFHLGKIYLTSNINDYFSIKVAYSERQDYFAKANKLTNASIAKELELAGKWTQSINSDLQWSLIGRNLAIKEQDLLPNDKSKATILGKLDYVWSLADKSIKSTTSYNTNSGQEPKVEYVFQKVEIGQGDYFLINESDTPNLSNLQDFRYDPSNPLSSYIRLALNNNEFIRTNNNEINQSVSVDVSKWFSQNDTLKNKKWFGFLSKLTTLSTVRINKKKQEGAANSYLGYFDFTIADSSIVAYNAMQSHSIFYNRGDVKYDIQIGKRSNQNRINQISGLEDRGLIEYFTKIRLNVMSQTDLFLQVDKTIKTYQSKAFSDRNLDIDGYTFSPECSYRPNATMRINCKYSYQIKNQKIISKDEATFSNITTEFAWRKANSFSFDASLSMVSIRFTGLANSPIEYDMLEGLKNGKNYLWNANITKRIAKNMDLTFVYEGRKTGISNSLHVARAQVKATF